MDIRTRLSEKSSDIPSEHLPPRYDGLGHHNSRVSPGQVIKTLRTCIIDGHPASRLGARMLLNASMW